MFAQIARFEFGYQTRNPVFWVAAILFFLLAFGSIASDNIQLGAGGNVLANSPYATSFAHLFLSLFYMFVTTAFVANVVVRDDDTKFGPIVRSTRITKFQYLFGRFTGAFAAAALAFLAVPLGLLVGSGMPWLDKETIGPVPFAGYAFAYAVLSLPVIFLTSAIFFALATATRSMMTTYVGLIVFLVLFFVTSNALSDRPDLETLRALIDPFALEAFTQATRYWTAAERNVRLVPWPIFCSGTACSGSACRSLSSRSPTRSIASPTRACPSGSSAGSGSRTRSPRRLPSRARRAFPTRRRAAPRARNCGAARGWKSVRSSAAPLSSSCSVLGW
jgi:ABC-type transport system involved in multi-copper enzyme maturation permease subunit